jgi:hypothetical protein
MRYSFGLLLFTAVAGAQQYVISTYAGGNPLPTPVPALEAPIGFPPSAVADASGNLYFGFVRRIRGSITAQVACQVRPHGGFDALMIWNRDELLVLLC